jgi:hypothetical protein
MKRHMLHTPKIHMVHPRRCGRSDVENFHYLNRYERRKHRVIRERNIRNNHYRWHKV